MIKDEIENCKGHQVVIMASGIEYCGTLIGASEDSLSLQTPFQFIELPMDQVSWIKKTG